MLSLLLADTLLPRKNVHRGVSTFLRICAIDCGAAHLKRLRKGVSPGNVICIINPAGQSATFDGRLVLIVSDTGVDDMTATTLNPGDLSSGVLFAILIAILTPGYWRFRFNAIFAFWFAYIVTRPPGASFADWFGKPAGSDGVGLGTGPTCLVLALLIISFVGYLSATRKDITGD